MNNKPETTATLDKREAAVESYRQRWLQYEQEKRSWAALHPAATSREYEDAIKRILEDSGL